jgi:hypothetical protein
MKLFAKTFYLFSSFCFLMETIKILLAVFYGYISL